MNGLEHIALSVRDLDRSLRFYRDLIGLRVERIVESPPERGLGAITGLAGCAARIAHLRSGAFMLELFEYTVPRGQDIPADRTQADLGFSHMGFSTQDIHADWGRLREHGVEFLGEPVEFRPGVWVVYFRGPDGEICELRQTPQETTRSHV